MTAIGCLNSKPRVCLAGRLAIALAVCLLTAAADVDRDEAAARRKRIEEMSAVEREQLAQKHATFLSMSPDRQDALRHLHAEIEADARAGGSLREVLRNYDAWLRTLSPWQRAEVRAESDPAARLELIRRLKDEDNEAEDPSSAEQPMPSGATGRGDSQKRRSRVRLSGEDFERVMNIVTDDLELPEVDRQALAGLSPPQRHVQVLIKILEREPPAAGGSSSMRWPSDELMDQIVGAITDPKVLERLNPSDEPREHRHRRLRMLVLNAVRREASDELKKRRPTDEQMREYFRGLKPEERERLMKQWGNDRLVWKYLEERGDAFARDYVQLHKALSARFPRNDDRSERGRPRRPPNKQNRRDRSGAIRPPEPRPERGS